MGALVQPGAPAACATLAAGLMGVACKLRYVSEPMCTDTYLNIKQAPWSVASAILKVKGDDTNTAAAIDTTKIWPT